LGFGVNSPFGVGTAYDTDSPFNYITTGGEIKVVAVNPNIAWKATDKVSLAAGAAYYRSRAEVTQQFKWSASANPALSTAADGSMKIRGDGDGWGADAAVLWKPKEGHAFGLSYRTQVVVKLGGKNAEITNVPAPLRPLFGDTYRTGGKTMLRYPDIVNLGYAFHPAKKWLVEVGGHWINWTDFDKADFQFDSNAVIPNNTLPIYWKNAFAVRAGFEFSKSETLSIGGGYFFDRTPTRESTYTPLIPDSDHHVATAGLRWRIGRFEILPALGFIYSQDKKVTSERTDPYPAPFHAGQTTSGTYSLYGYKLDLGLRYGF
jgi:long-chain fatty acid transport protein